jgi:hypothetical protein
MCHNCQSLVIGLENALSLDMMEEVVAVLDPAGRRFLLLVVVPLPKLWQASSSSGVLSVAVGPPPTTWTATLEDKASRRC